MRASIRPDQKFAYTVLSHLRRRSTDLVDSGSPKVQQTLPRM